MFGANPRMGEDQTVADTKVGQKTKLVQCVQFVTFVFVFISKMSETLDLIFSKVMVMMEYFTIHSLSMTLLIF